MDISDRSFEPPAQDLAKINARLGRLPPPLPEMIHRAGEALAGEDLHLAQALLGRAMTMAPGQADVLRLYGLLLARIGNLPAAFANFDAALRAAPDDAMGYWQYAQVLEQTGDVAAAWRLREQAVQRLPDSPMALSDLGEHLARRREFAEARRPLERATRLAPDYAPAWLRLGNVLVSCGCVEDGAAAIRKTIALEPAFGAAWIDLTDIRSVPITEDELEQMRQLLRGRAIDESERTAIGFALARACEEHARYAEAYALLIEANARRKREVGAWDATRFETQAVLTREVFGPEHVAAADPHLGEQAIFIVGLPRSGTTLVEQILASHPGVHGAGELGELAQVLTEESMRREQRFPEWVPAAATSDWQRLGQRYLELTARYGHGQARFTDKMLNNWQALGAIRAMLPGARVVICRRAPLENCWSCFKQYFAHGWEFTYDIDQLALFWREFDRTASWWTARDPAYVREQGYEALTEDPEQEIRALLEFCRLPFDPACLDFHQTARDVHTLSAGQVRQPMRRHVDVAVAYGELLDPLQSALGIAPSNKVPLGVDGADRRA